MAYDVIITPASGLIDFKNGTTAATIQNIGNDLNISSTNGYVNINSTTGANTIIDFGSSGFTTAVTLLGGGYIGANGNSLTLGLSGDIVNLNAVGVTYNFPSTIQSNALTATTLATARTISLTGNVTGSTSFDGSANVSISSSLAATLSPATATELGAATNLNNLNAAQAGFYYQTANADTTGNNYPSNEAGSLIVQKSAGNATQLYQTYATDAKLFVRSNYNAGYGAWQRVFADNYHPNADTLTTARTLTIGATGKTFNGSANVSWSLAEIGAQETLVSGTNIKTVNGSSILGAGDISTTSAVDNIIVLTANANATLYATHAATSSVTLTLPASPTVGNWIYFSNRSGTSTCVIARNGSNIMSLAENLTVDASNASFKLTYVSAAQGWVIV